VKLALCAAIGLTLAIGEAIACTTATAEDLLGSDLERLDRNTEAIVLGVVVWDEICEKQTRCRTVLVTERIKGDTERLVQLKSPDMKLQIVICGNPRTAGFLDHVLVVIAPDGTFYMDSANQSFWYIESMRKHFARSR